MQGRQQRDVKRGRRGDDAHELVPKDRHQRSGPATSEQRSGGIVEQPDAARAGDQIDQRERRDRHHANGGDREHALPHDPLTDCGQARPEPLPQHVAPEHRADA